MGNINEAIQPPFSAAYPIEPTKPLPQSDPLAEDIANHSGCSTSRPDTNLHSLLMQRQLGLTNAAGPQTTINGARLKAHAAQRFLPLKKGGQVILSYSHRIFCGSYSPDGTIFMTATQDRKIRFYDTNTWTEQKVVQARDVGWSILGTDYSNDQQWLIYSGWSDSVHLTNVTGEHQKHEALDFNKQSHYFCLFSVKFSPDSNEILGGSSDHCLYVYDLSRKDVVARVPAHDQDINTVAYGETGNNNLMFSSGDDCLIKVWDRRTMSQSNSPVGLLIGHTHGITHVAPKGDGIHLISNGKDQSLKLWDIRKMHTQVSDTLKYAKRSGDYRYGILTSPPPELDLSVSSYRGHEVAKTLIRCDFSPMSTTGQKYIYTGSSNGMIHIYDIVTGKSTQLAGHYTIVRDLSWHPHLPHIVSTSWDGSVGKWSSRDVSQTPFNPREAYADDDEEEEEEDSEYE